jgi:chemotaxis protein methyltransferase CheR
MVSTQTATAEAASLVYGAGSGDILSDRNFARLSELVYRVCGINLTAKKKGMVDGRLRRRMRSIDIVSINDYCQFLFEGGPASDIELVYLVDAVTTNKTDFFREPAHFVFLQNCVFPSWRAEGRHRAKIWSAASSTGAEAYTIAMVTDDFYRQGGSMDYRIVASDICTDVLEKGNQALYPDSMLEPIPEEFRRRYVLVPKDMQRHEFRIVAALRSRVSFQRLNLMDDRYAFDRDFDLIFLRNVLIYFDRPTQERVLAKLCDHLRSGGYLFLGHSESLVASKFPVDMVANTIFRRR